MSAAAIAVILVVALVLGVRTKGAAELIADYLRDRTGLDVKVGRARLALPADLVLENVGSREAAPGNGEFAAEEVRLRWQPDGATTVRARGVRLSLVRTMEGEWKPDPFAALGALTNVAQTAALFDEIPGVALDVRDGAIYWTTEATNTTSVEGLTLRVTPVRVEGRLLRVFDLQASRVTRAGGIRGRAVRRSWIGAEENPYLELTYRGIWDETEPAGRDWWSANVPAPAAGGGLK